MVTDERPTYLNPVLLGGIAVAGASLLAYLVGLHTHATDPIGCRSSFPCPTERDVWSAATRDWFLGAFLLGLLTTWAAIVWRPISTSAGLRRVGSVVVLVVCVPITCVLTIVAFVVAGTTCTDEDFLCFGGPGTALVVAIPAALTGALCVLAAIGLVSEDEHTGRLCGSVAVTALSGMTVLVAAGFVLGGLGI